jgi:hypothetical protein
MLKEKLDKRIINFSFFYLWFMDVNHSIQLKSANANERCW